MYQQRAIIAFDGKVYLFQTHANELTPVEGSSVIMLDDDPLKPHPLIYEADQKPRVVDYLDLDLNKLSEITNMVPSRWLDDKFLDLKTDNRKELIKALTHTYPKDNKYTHQGLNCKVESGRDINYGDYVVTRNDDIFIYDHPYRSWNLRLANFTFKPNNVKVVYAPNPVIFIRLCKKYELNQMFKPNMRSMISLHPDVISRKGDNMLLYGTQDKHKCVVKRVLAVKSRSDFFCTAIKLRLCSDHPNVVRIYEVKFDGDYFNIAMERCMYNFSQFAKKKKDYDLSKSIINGALLGLAHFHHNGVIHGDVHPSNILINVYANVVVARLGGLSRSRYHKSGDATLTADIPMNWKKEGWYTRDLVGAGRTILNFETRGDPEFADDYASDYNCQDIKFKEDMKELSKKNPIAHDLVQRLVQSTLTRSMSATLASEHYYFWPRGMYLSLIEVTSDRITGDNRDTYLEELVEAKGSEVFQGTWLSPGTQAWFTAKGGDEEYKTDKMSHLLRITRNTVHHPVNDDTWTSMKGTVDKETSDIMKKSTEAGFEAYINYHFRGLYNAICLVVEKYTKEGHGSFPGFFGKQS